MPTGVAEKKWFFDGTLFRRRGLTSDPVNPTYPTPTVPAGVTVEEFNPLRDGFGVPTETFAQTIVRQTTGRPRIIHVPAGLYELIDFDPNNGYSLIAVDCLGIIGDGEDVTIIQMRENSSTQVAKVPTQVQGGSNPLTLIRLSKDHVLSMGWTLSGTDQAIDPHTGKPHLYSGLLNYIGTNSKYADIKITGIPGDWYSPPGETFAFNCYKDTNTEVTRMEVDGFIWKWTSPTTKVKGNRVGGSPNGRNNSINYKEWGCWYHDSYVSGFTSSYAGASNSMAATTKGVFTDHILIDGNANYTFAAGKTFPGINHENVYGTIRHQSPTIKMASYPQWDVAHMVFDSQLGDNTDITILDPVWNGSYSRFGGMFTLKTGINYNGVPNTQGTAPTVIIGGNVLTPHRYTSNPGSVQNFNPLLHYAWISG
jgi:hypothetical protein